MLLSFQENVTLINEINDLRRELKLTRTQVNDLEAMLGTTKKSSGKTGKRVSSLGNFHTCICK